MEYIYDPRKAKAKHPPLTKHMFKVAFSVCSESCPFQYVHRCRFGSTGTDGLERIPKKCREWDFKAADPDSDHAWGLKACPGLCGARIVMYNLLILLGPYAFWAYWQGTHPTDMQNASVPTMFVLSLITLFWTLSGAMNVLRESLQPKS